MKDYTFLCECGWESTAIDSMRTAKKWAREHAIEDAHCGVKNPTIFIDEYDHELNGGEMSGRWEKIRVATPAKR
jgi:hypothetical protein